MSDLLVYRILAEDQDYHGHESHGIIPHPANAARVYSVFRWASLALTWLFRRPSETSMAAQVSDLSLKQPLNLVSFPTSG
ncbi:hypothetical protein L6452_00730 [Arctium lappa]|uniref:Uncharacterized protein n=1 Tax=Arctium lappa TaxID=4217 RepID=A0ACB9FFJ0_ARCLA|nr:hypothetical protein L6452_00730 [Arctium lappa]